MYFPRKSPADPAAKVTPDPSSYPPIQSSMSKNLNAKNYQKTGNTYDKPSWELANPFYPCRDTGGRTRVIPNTQASIQEENQRDDGLATSSRSSREHHPPPYHSSFIDYPGYTFTIPFPVCLQEAGLTCPSFTQTYIEQGFPSFSVLLPPLPVRTTRRPNHFLSFEKTALQNPHHYTTTTQQGPLITPSPCRRNPTVAPSRYQFSRPPLPPSSFLCNDTLDRQDDENKGQPTSGAASSCRRIIPNTAPMRDEPPKTFSTPVADTEESPSPLNPEMGCLSIGLWDSEYRTQRAACSKSFSTSDGKGRQRIRTSYAINDYCSSRSSCSYHHDERSWWEVTVSPTTPSDIADVEKFCSPLLSSPLSEGEKCCACLTNEGTPKRDNGEGCKKDGRWEMENPEFCKEFSYGSSVALTPPSLYASPQLHFHTPTF